MGTLHKNHVGNRVVWQKNGILMQNLFLSRILKAYYKNRTPGLNIVNQKGPLALAGSSPYCVLLQVVSEDIVTLYNVCSVHRGMFSTSGVFSTLGDTMSTLGDIMSTSGGVQYIGRIP